MIKIYKKLFPVFLSLCLMLQSCAPTLVQNKNNDLKIPEVFDNQDSDLAVEKKDLVKQNWKLFFEDEKLVALIETALKTNQDLNILDQEISIASNEVLARQGQYLPKVGVGVNYELEKTSKFTSKGAADDITNLPETLHNRQLALNTSWEVDIWGKLRGYAKSAYLEYLSSIEGKNFAVTQLVSEVANDYFELMSLDNQLEIVNQYIATLKQAEQIVELQKAAGHANLLAVKRFNAEVLKNQSRRYIITQQIIVAENHLNIILGRLPQHIERNSSKFKNIKMQEVATDIPAALLDNRPDVRQASLKIEAAKLNLKSVKKEFYPSLNIDGSVGYKSFNSRHFVDPAAFFYGVAGGLTAPLLNRNAIKADYFTANNRQIEAIYNYEKTFITAYAEVSNQLAAVNNLNKVYDLKTKQAKALSDSFEISNILFKAARQNYLESLLTRRDYLEVQVELVEVKKQQLAAYVNLYKALGGGWRE